MRLSDAIRLGAMLHPQIHGGLYRFDTLTNNVIGTCAFGAAMVAGYPRAQTDISHRTRVKCPTCRERDFNVSQVIVHLNDDHRWTREQIADWVETIERASLNDLSEAVRTDAAVARTVEAVTG